MMELHESNFSSQNYKFPNSAAAAVGELEEPAKNLHLQDKRLQELRAFALEYVKQIVAKASELSQERQEAKNAQKLSQFYSGASLPLSANTQHHHSNSHLPDHTTLIELREQANKINDRFQQLKTLTRVDRKKPQDECREDGRCEQEDDYDADADEVEGEQTAALTGSKSNKQKCQHKGESKKRTHHKLNWHLLISCFSTCLPHNLADTIPSSSSCQMPGGSSAS